MINLIIGETYKRTKRKSFLIAILLTILISFIIPIFINKSIDSEKIQEPYPLLTKEEYKATYKYGNYNTYKKNYNNYTELVEKNNTRILNNETKKSKTLLNNSISIYYIAGFIIIFISFQTLSYEYTKNTIRYIFISNNGRKAFILSVLLTNLLLIIFFILLSYLISIISVTLITKESIFLLKDTIYFLGKLKTGPLYISYLIKAIKFIPPLFLISTM